MQENLNTLQVPILWTHDCIPPWKFSLQHQELYACAPLFLNSDEEQKASGWFGHVCQMGLEQLPKSLQEGTLRVENVEGGEATPGEATQLDEMQGWQEWSKIQRLTTDRVQWQDELALLVSWQQVA